MVAGAYAPPLALHATLGKRPAQDIHQFLQGAVCHGIIQLVASLQRSKPGTGLQWHTGEKITHDRYFSN